MHPHPRDGSLLWVFLITHQHSLLADSKQGADPHVCPSGLEVPERGELLQLLRFCRFRSHFPPKTVG